MHLLFIIWLLEGSLFCIIIEVRFFIFVQVLVCCSAVQLQLMAEKRARSEAVSTVEPSDQINTGRKTSGAAVMRELRKMQNQEMKLTNTSASQWQADKIQLTRSPASHGHMKLIMCCG